MIEPMAFIHSIEDSKAVVVALQSIAKDKWKKPLRRWKNRSRVFIPKLNLVTISRMKASKIRMALREIWST